MKINADKRKEMADLIDTTLQAVGATRADINTEGLMRRVWYKTYCFATYGDDNPNAYHNGKRVFEQRDDVELYPCDSNDDTLLTALRAIFKGKR